MPEDLAGGNFKRRDMLQLVLSAGVVVWMGGITKFVVGESKLVRPPGALAPQDFISTCMRCQQCVGACPTQVIQPVAEWEDIANAGTPQLNFNSGSCNYCMECADVCPSGALQPVSRESARLGGAVISPDVCGAYNQSGCTQCVSSCTRQAIRLDPANRPVVNSGNCDGCGECVQSCPGSSCGRQNARGECAQSCPGYSRSAGGVCSSVRRGIFIEPVF